MTKILVVNGGITLAMLIAARRIMDRQPVPDMVSLDQLSDEQIHVLRNYDLPPEPEKAEQRHDWWNQGRKY